jgi:hypothetical protein
MSNTSSDFANVVGTNHRECCIKVFRRVTSLIFCIWIGGTCAYSAVATVTLAKRQSEWFVEAHRGDQLEFLDGPGSFSEGVNDLESTFVMTASATGATSSTNSKFQSKITLNDDLFRVETLFEATSSFNVQSPDEHMLVPFGKGANVQSRGGGFIKFDVTEPRAFTVTTSHQFFEDNASIAFLSNDNSPVEIFHTGRDAPGFQSGGTFSGILSPGSYQLFFTGAADIGGEIPSSGSGTTRMSIVFVLVPEPASTVLLAAGCLAICSMRRRSGLVTSS